MLRDRDLDRCLERVLPYLIFPPRKFRNEIADLTKALFKAWRGQSTETFERLSNKIDDALEKRKKFDSDREMCISSLTERHWSFDQRISKLGEKLARLEKELLDETAGVKERRWLWSEEELEILREGYPTLPREEMEKRLPGRTWNAIKTRAHGLGLKRR